MGCCGGVWRLVLFFFVWANSWFFSCCFGPPCVWVFVCGSLFPPVFLPACLSVCFICLSVCLSVSSVCLTVSSVGVSIDRSVLPASTPFAFRLSPCAINQLVRRCPPYAVVPASQAVLCGMQVTHSPFMRLAEHLTVLRAWCNKQCPPGR